MFVFYYYGAMESRIKEAMTIMTRSLRYDTSYVIKATELFVCRHYWPLKMSQIADACNKVGAQFDNKTRSIFILN